MNKKCIKHKIIYTKSHRLVIKYDRSGMLNIRAPQGITIKEIDDFVNRHMDWVFDHYEQSQPKTRNYNDGEELEVSNVKIVKHLGFVRLLL